MFEKRFRQAVSVFCVDKLESGLVFPLTQKLLKNFQVEDKYLQLFFTNNFFSPKQVNYKHRTVCSLKVFNLL